jgi:hypothetical protein
MRISQPATISILAGAALALSSCTVKSGRGDIALTGVVLSKYTAASPPAQPTASCACPTPPASETDYVRYSTYFVPCLQVENRMPNNGDGKIRLNTNDFVVDDVQVTYESTSSTVLNIPTQIIAVAGYVPAAGKTTVPATIVPSAVNLPLEPVRLRMFLEGHLLDGTKIKTSEYEYIAIHTPGATSDNCNY